MFVDAEWIGLNPWTGKKMQEHNLCRQKEDSLVSGHKGEEQHFLALGALF